MRTTHDQRAGEYGAVSIKTLLVLFLAGVVIFAVIKFVPVYTEKRQIIFDVEELANKSAVRNMREDDVCISGRLHRYGGQHATILGCNFDLSDDATSIVLNFPPQIPR